VKFQCPPNRPFRCKNDRVCLWIGRQCDGIDNCGDNTDEKDCGECRPGWLPALGRSLRGAGLGFAPLLLPQSWGQLLALQGPPQAALPLLHAWGRAPRAPGRHSAARTSTESPTAKPKSCSQDKNEFLCENKKCISANLRCNFFDDCGDGSDEKSCSHGGCEQGAGGRWVAVWVLTYLPPQSTSRMTA